MSTNANGTAASAKISVPENAVFTPASMEAGPISAGEGLASRKWRWAAVALLVAAGATLARNDAGLRDRVFAKNSVGPIHSIAVLPLANLSGDPSQDYYADGLTDEFVTALARNRSLRVPTLTRRRCSRLKTARPGWPRRELHGVGGLLLDLSWSRRNSTKPWQQCLQR